MRKLCLILSSLMGLSCSHQSWKMGYPDHWWKVVADKDVPNWEILPQAASRGEVILSKRNELGILSNFAPTPFVLDGESYASIEGFWQMMLFPEGPGDPRLDSKVSWMHTRDDLKKMSSFEAKRAGAKARENMKLMGIDWVSYRGERFPYRSTQKGKHYELIRRAMKAKLEQNPEVKRILLLTGDLVLLPDHQIDSEAPPEWRYYDIWMEFREELRQSR